MGTTALCCRAAVCFVIRWCQALDLATEGAGCFLEAEPQAYTEFLNIPEPGGSPTNYRRPNLKLKSSRGIGKDTFEGLA